MNRFEELKDILMTENCFKMICGAGNEDAPYVKKLSFIYTLVGAKILDVSANPNVVRHAKEGIDLAFERSTSFGIDVGVRPFIMVSVGMPGDHHVRKSYIDPHTCVECGLCIPVCPTDAIPSDFVSKLEVFKQLDGTFDTEDQSKEIVIKNLCIGCGKCSNICPKDDIISYRHNYRELEKLLPQCMEAGAETFELHAAVGEDDITLKEWELITSTNPHNFNSVCLDRLNLGNLNLEYRIEQLKNISNDKLIIQSDGYPMSGGENDFNTTLQAVACADVINKKFNMRVNKKIKKEGSGKAELTSKKSYRPSGHRLGVFILLSGGTNALTRKLTQSCDVRCNGVSIGTYARDIIENLVTDEMFWSADNIILNALEIAKDLVKENEI
jgi:ferredoxin